MLVYRVSRTKYANDLAGEGARLFGGRWNRKMVACVYTSESRALALLEYTVNAAMDDIPRALSIITIEIPGGPIKLLSEAELPGDWMHSPAPSSTKEFGSQLLLNGDTPIIRVPSTVIVAEYNYLLNPLHRDSNQFKIVAINDLVYDIRIKAV